MDEARNIKIRRKYQADEPETDSNKGPTEEELQL